MLPSALRALRLLADPNRLRLILLLEREELSVAELQQILSLGQSNISTQLAQLKRAGLVEDRRSGKNIFYRATAAGDHSGGGMAELMGVLRRSAQKMREAAHDASALELVLRRRKDKVREYFDELAGRFGREYVPGRSWQAVAEMLLALLPPLVVADLGAGEATFSLMLAQHARKVIAVDNSERMVRYGSALAREREVKNLDYRRGDLETLPIRDKAVDLAVFSQSLHHAQHPERAVAEAWRILKPGGRVAILDLARHQFDRAHELYADVWLGFSEADLQRLLRKAGFREVDTKIVHRESEAPHFETLLATGSR